AVVSGMARGIDGAAAAGALAAGCVTLAVLGCGLDGVYPPEHRPLMARIAGEGAVISEFPPGSPPAASHFPVRNRIISGLSRGVYVVEAGATSGAVLTAGEAVRQGREVFALPGRSTDPQSEGTNRLLRDGARAATDACDILDFYRERFPDAFDADGYARSVCFSEPDRGFVSSLGIALPGERRRVRASATPSETAPPPREAPATSAAVPEDERLRKFFELIEPGTPVCADCFAAGGYSAPEAMNLLSLLEISGYVKSIPGGMYIRH
ncbi:MAG: DNA-processing protein DprA, partial [Clostridia bacterium]|nr:DNA-processing protein DprA [Clostridia bacterium]